MTVGLEGGELGVKILEGARDGVRAEKTHHARDAAINDLSKLRFRATTGGPELASATSDMLVDVNEARQHIAPAEVEHLGAQRRQRIP